MWRGLFESHDMNDVRKPLEELLSEQNAHRRMQHRNFISLGDGQQYQVLMLAWTEDTNDLHVVYVLCAFPQLKFTMPVERFLERFEPSKGLEDVAQAG